MKILILSFYYFPDLCAGSFRTAALVDALKKYNNVELEIITTSPNRYSSYGESAEKTEINGNVKINRVEIPSHNSGMVDQAKSFFVFYFKALKIAKQKKYDLVFSTSSRLFTAFLGARIASKGKIPLYLDVRDIFLDTIKDVLPPRIVFFLAPWIELVENYSFSKADHINLVSKGFQGYFLERYKKLSYSFFTNGIDEEFIECLSQAREGVLSKKINILYAGNIGEGQGLHEIIPELAKNLGELYHITIIGDGGKKDILKRKVEKIENVSLLPPIKRKDLIQYYLSADILFLHLNDYPAFKKVLPSKIFEYAAMNKPILAGVSGYAAGFLKKNVDGAYVFNPTQVTEALNLVADIKLKPIDRQSFVERYSRKNIMSEMAESIFSVKRRGKDE